MKCLMRFEWVKLMRSHLPQGKGIMGYWAKLASRAAFRKGHAVYCGYKNEVIPGMWSGGIVGLKSILGIKNRKIALETMDKLSELGFIKYELNPETKKLTYLSFFICPNRSFSLYFLVIENTNIIIDNTVNANNTTPKAKLYCILNIDENTPTVKSICIYLSIFCLL